MWFKNEACESKDKYDKFIESLDYWEHLHLSMALYCLNHPDVSNDEAYAECLVDGEPSLAYRLKAACHIENNSRDKANTNNKLENRWFKERPESVMPTGNYASRQVSPMKVPPAKPVPKPLESTAVKHVLPTRKFATRKYVDKLIAEIDDAIDKNIGTAGPIEVDVTNYNEAVVNEVIESLKNSGWEVHGIYGGGFDRMAAITLS